MGCEQLVQHAKVSKNRKFIPHFRENLARPLDKGGVGVVYLPCNPQSAASVREVINIANRLIHRVTAEVINPFQQLSTLYRHIVDTSLPLGRTAAPVYSRAAALFHRFTAAPLPGLQLNRSIVARFPAAPLTAAPFYLHHPSVFPPCHSIAVLLFAVPLLCCTEASLSFSRFTAAPLYRCSVSSLYSGIAPPVFPSRLCRFAASPVSAPSARKPFPALCFSFSGMPLPPLSRDVCLPGVGSGRLPGGLGNGAPDAAAALRSAPEIPFHILARAIPPPAVESRPLRLSRTGTQDGGAGRRRGKRRRSGRGEEEDMKGEERGKGAVGTLTWRGGATLPGRNSGEPRLGRTGPLTGRAPDEPGP